MYNIFLFIFFILINFKLYFTFTLEYINFISHIYAYFNYYLNIKRNIIDKNIKNVFPNIDKKKINNIRFNTIKISMINLLIGINIHIFGNSFLEKYYKNKIKLNRKSFVFQCHIGLYYDFYSFFKLTNKKSFYGIFKGKFNFNKFKETNLLAVHHNKINFNILHKFLNIFTTIDHSNKKSKLEVIFLNKKYKFNYTLVNYSIENNRDIYFYYTLLINNKIENNLVKINTKNKILNDICQDIANEMNKIILKYPEQYSWNFKSIN